jgi:hypothetical protein
VNSVMEALASSREVDADQRSLNSFLATRSPSLILFCTLAFAVQF